MQTPGSANDSDLQACDAQPSSCHCEEVVTGPDDDAVEAPNDDLLRKPVAQNAVSTVDTAPTEKLCLGPRITGIESPLDVGRHSEQIFERWSEHQLVLSSNTAKLLQRWGRSATEIRYVEPVIRANLYVRRRQNTSCIQHVIPPKTRNGPRRDAEGP
jgi:hypothetical protein